MPDREELQAVGLDTPSYSNLSRTTGSSITPPSPRDNNSDEEVEWMHPLPAEAVDPPEAVHDCPQWCLAVTKSTLVGGFVGGTVGGSTLGLLGAIACGLGGAYVGALLGTCLEFICPPLVAQPDGQAPALDIELA